MPIQKINIGTAPNSGDGDALRTAFDKINGNFEELFGLLIPVTDTTLEDHSDAGTAGTIAWALEQTRSDGGGTVMLGPGIFNVTTSTLSVPQNTRLLGSGIGCTTISSSHANHVITADDIQGDEYFSIESLHIELPSQASSGDGIFIQNGLNLTLRDIYINGGSPTNWGISLYRTLIFVVERIFIEGFCNGLRIYNDTTIPINYGDGLVTAVHIQLFSPRTTGILIAGPDSSLNVINNILISQCEVAGREAGAGASGECTGVHIYNSNRITLLNVDSEIVLNCFLHEGGVAGGSGGAMNAFIQCFAIGVNGYIENSRVGETLILGGFGDLQDIQRIPSDTLSVYASPTIGYLPLQRSYRENELYTDTSAARALTLADSGKTLTNQNASGTVEFLLPPAFNKQGAEFLFMLSDSQPIRITLRPGNVFRPSNKFSGIPGSGKTVESDSDAVSGTFLHIRSIDAATWCVLSMNGNWTFIN